MNFRHTVAILAAIVASFLFAGAIQAAPPVDAIPSITPLTRSLGAVITNTAQGAGTVNSADQSCYDVSRLVCVFNQASHTGTPSSTFTVQGKDTASGGYYTLLTSAAITADTTPTPIQAGAGLATTANVSAGVVIPALWRISETVGGTTPGVTGTVGCAVQ
ncbi:MAG: hypothetical protein ACREIC_15715 [Limisphaerales bacterium]